MARCVTGMAKLDQYVKIKIVVGVGRIIRVASARTPVMTNGATVACSPPVVEVVLQVARVHQLPPARQAPRAALHPHRHPLQVVV